MRSLKIVASRLVTSRLHSRCLVSSCNVLPPSSSSVVGEGGESPRGFGEQGNIGKNRTEQGNISQF